MTTLEILQAYPLGALEVTPIGDFAGIITYRIVGLTCDPGDSQTLQLIRSDSHTDSDDISTLACCEVLPVLRSFADLPSVIVETHWGPTAASVVLARMITHMQVMPENVRPFGNSLSAQDYSSGPFKIFLHESTVVEGNLMQPVVDFLRRHHFAVGLTADQYIRKEE